MLNIVYDATILTNYIYKSAARSGIFFVAFNVLRELSSRENVHVELYFDSEKLFEGLSFRNDFFPNLALIQSARKECLFSRLNKKCWRVYNSKSYNPFVKGIAALGIFVSRKVAKRSAARCLNIESLKNSDVFVSPVYQIPKMIRRYSMKKALVLYDPAPYIYPEFFKSKNSVFLDGIKCSSRDDDFFFFDSYSALNDFKNYFPFLNAKNSFVIHLAANDLFKKDDNEFQIKRVRYKYRIPPNKRYVFSLCTIEPRKNIVRAVKTFIDFIEKNKIQDLIWVMGGGQWNSFAEELRRNNVEWDSEQICRIGYVDDDDLPILYSNAEWFVYTSQYEGFGLPPLEAMQCGCPVITSNNSSLPEVVGDAGIMIDWDSDEQHVAAYEKYYFNESFRQECAQKGLQKAKQFSWKKTVDAMIDAFYLED